MISHMVGRVRDLLYISCMPQVWSAHLPKVHSMASCLAASTPGHGTLTPKPSRILDLITIPHWHGMPSSEGFLFSYLKAWVVMKASMAILTDLCRFLSFSGFLAFQKWIAVDHIASHLELLFSGPTVTRAISSPYPIEKGKKLGRAW